MSRKIRIANPSDRSWSRTSFLFAFGAIGTTYVLAYGSDLDSCLEAAAEWVAEHAPGHIMPVWGPEHTELVRQACLASGLEYPPPDGADYGAEGYYLAQAMAETDLTYTESGYLTSYEWFIVLECPEKRDLIDFYHNR